MPSCLVVSDIHFSGPGERARGNYEDRIIPGMAARLLLRFYRRFVWLRDPLAHSHLLDRVLNPAFSPDLVIANGDYSCDSAFVGVCDSAARESASHCLTALRQRYSPFMATIGDHELGKKSLVGGAGGLRWESYERSRNDLGLEPFWQFEIGNYVLIGVTSTLLAMPIFQREALPEELPLWHQAEEEHLATIRSAFRQVRENQRILFFCHDPSALPFLWKEEEVRKKIGQIERTIIGHLHSRLVLWQSQILAGMPSIHFLGTTVRRLSLALNEAKHWRHFKPLLCPSLAGIELAKQGGYYRIDLPEDRTGGAQFTIVPVPRH